MPAAFTDDQLPNAFKAHTAHDTTALPPKTWFLYVGDVSGGASVVVTDQWDQDVTYQNVPVGTTLNITGAKLIKATGTTAAGFIINYYRTPRS